MASNDAGGQGAAGRRAPAGPGWLMVAATFVGETSILAGQAAWLAVRGKFSLRETIRQMAAMGVDSIPIIMLTCAATGSVLAFYVADVLVRFGGSGFVGGMIALSFLLELGPVLAGVMVAARSGAAVAAEIGSMVVTEQIDALRMMSVPPVRYLVTPRVLACILMMPICGLFADMAGIFGGLVMASTHGVTQSAFMESIRTMATHADLMKGLAKTLWFGLTIAVVACHQGLNTQRGATGVGAATTRSVVLCVVFIFVSDFFLAQALSGASASMR